MWNVYMACSKALRVQHDRPQTIQGQPFEQGHLKPCWVGRLAFHCGRKLAVISTKNQLLAAMANWNQCCRLRRLWSFINQDLMMQNHEKRKHFLAVFSKTANESLATLSHSEKLSSNPLWMFDVFLLKFDQATKGKEVSFRMLLPALMTVQQTTWASWTARCKALLRSWEPHRRHWWAVHVTGVVSEISPELGTPEENWAAGLSQTKHAEKHAEIMWNGVK